MRLLIIALICGPALADSWVPNQLHPRRFAACLRETAPDASLTSVRTFASAHRFSDKDALLFHLAFYPGVEIPGLGLVHTSARTWWGKWWEKEEHAVALTLRTLARQNRTLYPATLFAHALSACGRKNYFCAALVSHNALRSLGRHTRAVHTAFLSGRKTDHSPQWFQQSRADWLAALPVMQKAFIPLRPDGKGDRWGEWYHFYGILTYALHEAALGKSPSSIDFVVRMNELLNPLLAGGQEEPEKAQLDRDSIEVAQWFLTDKNPPAVQCENAQTYTAGAWESEPEPFPLDL